MTLLLRAYAGAARLALPWAMRREEAKLSAAGMGARLPEKRGETRVARPPGPLIWLHAASVGESLSALALIERLSRRAFILVTTGTATSAELMGKRLPAGALHQFAPLDAPAAVARFLDHWAPDAAIFVESELWPNILRALDARGIPRALVNARLSEASLRAWRRRPASARALLAPFKLILTQSAALSTALEALGASAARPAPDLKSMAPPLPTDPDLMALVPSPAWVAASTHPGEEDIVLNAHAILLEYHPKITLLLAPRHPERGEEVASYIARRGWPVARRSAGAGPQGPVWLLDTLGELGSLYAACPIVFLGGSLTPMGGHNPYEPAQAGAAVIAGPHTTNFEQAYAAFHARSAAQSVGNAQDLASKVGNLLAHPPLLYVRREAAQAVATAQTEGLDAIEGDLAEALGMPAPRSPQG